jgi:hypothetical protein
MSVKTAFTTGPVHAYDPDADLDSVRGSSLSSATAPTSPPSARQSTTGNGGRQSSTTTAPNKRSSQAQQPQTPPPDDEDEPSATTTSTSGFLKPGIDLRQVIESFYTIYAYSKLKDIDDILKHFSGREQDLFRTLEVKYDVTFNRDGSCIPNSASALPGLGEPFLAPTPQNTSPINSKFAVDVKSRMAPAGSVSSVAPAPAPTKVVLQGGSAMM